MSLSNVLKSAMFAGVLASSLVGCATAKLVYHGINYKLGNSVDYLDDSKRPRSDEERAYEKELLSKSNLEIVRNGNDFVYVLHVQGTPYEMGRQHGVLLRQQVRENLAFINSLKGVYEATLEKKISELENEKSNAKDNSEIAKLDAKLKDKQQELNYLEQGYNFLEPYIPEHFKEEMKGLADGAQVSLDAVLFYHAVGDIVESGCSNYFLGSEATENKEMVQVRILDFPLAMKIQKNPVVTIAKPNEGNSFVNVGWAGFIGAVTGVNDKKITLGEMRGNNAVKAYFKHNPGEMTETLKGIPMPFLLRDVLQFDTSFDEVIKRLENASRTNAYVYVIGDGKSGESRAFITDNKLFKVYGANDFREALAMVEPDTLFKQINNVIFGGHNNSLINDKVGENYGRITEEMLKQDFNKALAMKDNLQIAIYNLSRMTLQVANADGTQGENAKACNQNYLFVDLSEAFDWFNENR